MMTLLILLPTDPDAPATCLRLDASGRILGRERLIADAPPLSTPPARVVLVVPGTDTRVLWLDLPARNQTQALAAASILLEDHIAGPRENLHIAIAPAPAPGSSHRLVVAVDRGVMQGWLDRAAALGISPDAVVPDCLMLPPAEGESLHAAAIDDRWAVRGERLAFSAESALAAMVVGERPLQLVSDPRQVEAMLAACAPHPAIDLLQYGYARAPARREGRAAYRRSAALAVALALSLPVLTGAQALRYRLAAYGLESRAETVAATVATGTEAIDDPLTATRSRLLALQSTDAFAQTAGALFAAVKRSDGAHLDALDYRVGDGLRATLFHADPAGLESIRAALAEAGLALEQAGSQAVDGGIRSDILVRTGA